MHFHSELHRDRAAELQRDARQARMAAAAGGRRGRPPRRYRLLAPLAAVRRGYGELRAAWRAGAHLPPYMPVRDYPFARR